jgi:hypothetical protein
MGVSIFHRPLIFVEVKIPIIVVFTKYDLLIMEHYRACSKMPDGKVEAKRRAEHTLRKVTEKLEELKVPFAPVSTLRKKQKEYGGQ